MKAKNQILEQIKYFTDKHFFAIQFYILLIPTELLTLKHFNSTGWKVGNIIAALFAGVIYSYTISLMAWVFWFFLNIVFEKMRLKRSGTQLATIIIIGSLLYGYIAVNNAIDNNMNKKHSFTSPSPNKSDNPRKYNPTPDNKPDPKKQPPSKGPVYRIGAECWDGSSSDATGRGACSHHGGVKYWIMSDGSKVPK